MISYKNLPDLDSAMKLIDHYVEELRTWCLVTHFDKENQKVMLVALETKTWKDYHELVQSNRENAAKTLIKDVSRLYKKEVYGLYVIFICFLRYWKGAKWHWKVQLQDIKYFYLEEERLNICQS